MKKSILQTTLKILLFNILCFQITYAQPNYTANDRVIPYDGSFRFGVNMGYYPNWTSEQLGHISAGNAALGIKGVGINTSRPALYEENLETFGYNALVPTFESFYQSGIRDMTVIVGGPSGAHRDYTQFCPGKFSDVFANLYEPIWDGGANGTPVNDKNYYALYLWKTVTTYKKYVKIWEIVNEPDYDESGTVWRSDFDENISWWRSNPDPCTYQLHAPIFHYIRMLRISWEVIKTVDPNAYVSVGALGYASFLDLVLRNTDNPNNGQVSADFPQKGGAYFDIMGYHIYPHLDGSLWTYILSTNQTLGFHRHSDGAIDSGLVKKQAFFQKTLSKYGYDGSKYPQKPWVVTEFNLPRRAFESKYVGSNELQVNSIIKAVVECYQRQILQLHVYQLGDISNPEEAFFEFQEMGLYNKLSANRPYNVLVNPLGVAYKTASDMLAGAKFDAAQTGALNLPRHIDGAAFKRANGQFVYVLWAKTIVDKSETANANYSFPSTINVSGLKKHEWNFSETNQKVDINPQNIVLTGAPIFLTASNVVVANLPDLTLTNLNLETPSVLAGQKVNFKVDVRNIGTGNATGNFNIKSYISKDNILSNDDIQDGTINTANYNAGFVSLQVQGASTTPSTLAAGQYFIITKVDADNQIGESDENNNILVSKATFTVSSSTNPVVTCDNNLLTNPSFEGGISGWFLGGEATNSARTGTGAIKMCKPEERVIQTIAAQAGKTYNYRVYMKNDPNTEGYFGIKFMNNSYTVLDAQLLGFGSPTYSAYNADGSLISRIAPTGTAYIEIFFAKSIGTGCVYVDDVCLTEGTGTGNPCTNDKEPPRFLKPCPQNSTVSTPFPAPPYAEVGWQYLGVTDNCSTATETVEPATPYIRLGAGGSATFKHTAKDAAGNTATCTYTITAVQNPCFSDNIPPQITCPSNISITAPIGQDSASVTLTLPTINDNCGIISSLKLTNLSGQELIPSNLVWKFPIGTTTLRWVATDYKGNSANCNFNTTVTRAQTGGGGSDIGLTISSVSTFKKWANQNFTISAKNNGNTAFSNVVVQFKFPTGTVSGGVATPSVGNWREWCVGSVQCFEWIIPSLLANTTATLNIPLFVLDVNTITATATLLSSTPVDNILANNSASITISGATPQIGLIQAKPTQLVPALLKAISPNPSEGDAVLSVESIVEKQMAVFIYNSIGTLLATEKRSLTKGENLLYLDMNIYPSGIYFIATEYQKTPVKFVKM